MDETSGIQAEETEQPHGDTVEVSLEEKYAQLKQEARKWEARAKENKAAADELAAIKAERMTEQEKLLERAESAEARIAQLTAEADRREAALRISKERNIPSELLLYCADEDAMNSFADSYAERQTPPSAPSAPASRIVRDENATVSTRDQFAASAARFFHQ